MAKVPSKGTVLQQELSMVFTAVAQLTEIGISGIESETYDATTLDTSGAGKEYSQTGYAEGGEVSVSGFWDPALAGHQAITDLITTPADQNWKVIFADTGTTEMPFTSAGVSWEGTAAMSDGLKFSSTLKVDGLPTLPT
jgi:predicted secreted protein